MKKMLCVIFLSVAVTLSPFGTQAATVKKPNSKPVAQLNTEVADPSLQSEVARLGLADLHDHLGHFGLPPAMFESACPVIQGYPTFYCCVIPPGCYCYLMWNLPKGCY